MKNLIIFLVIFTIPGIVINAQNIFNVFEIKHTDNIIDFNSIDQKTIETIELNSITRYMFSKNVGGSAIIRINDTTSNALAGITFLPTEWFRIDILGGISIQNAEKKSLLGLRLWLGNEIQDFWVNLDGGVQNLWLQTIYVIKITSWFALGGMADTNGFGPRMELIISPHIKIWGGLTGDWRNKNKRLAYPGYEAEDLFSHIGAKIIF